MDSTKRDGLLTEAMADLITDAQAQVDEREARTTATSEAWTVANGEVESLEALLHSARARRESARVALIQAVEAQAFAMRHLANLTGPSQSE